MKYLRRKAVGFRLTILYSREPILSSTVEYIRNEVERISMNTTLLLTNIGRKSLLAPSFAFARGFRMKALHNHAAIDECSPQRFARLLDALVVGGVDRSPFTHFSQQRLLRFSGRDWLGV